MGCFLKMKSENYPLPWNETLDIAYWQCNMLLIYSVKEWQAFQKGKKISELIPFIDEKIIEVELNIESNYINSR